MAEKTSQSNTFGPAILLLVVGVFSVIMALVKPSWFWSWSPVEALVHSIGTGPVIGALLGGGTVAIAAGLWKLLRR